MGRVQRSMRHDARSERRLGAEDDCPERWRRLRSSVGLHLKTMRVRGPLRETLRLTVTARISRDGRRCALRVESHAPAMAPSSGRWPRITRTAAARRTGRKNTPCTGCGRRRCLGAGQGLGSKVSLA